MKEQVQVQACSGLLQMPAAMAAFTGTKAGDVDLTFKTAATPFRMGPLMGHVSFGLLLTSALLVLPVILTNCFVAKRRNSPSVYSTIFLTACFGFSVSMLATTTPLQGDHFVLEANTTLCFVQGTLVQYSVCMMMTGWLLCGHALYKIVVGVATTLEELRANRALHIFGSIFLSGMLTIIPIFTIGKPTPQPNGLFCWLSSLSDHASNMSYFWKKLVSFYIEMFFILILGCYYIVKVLQRLRNVFNEQTESDPRQAIRDYVHRHTLLLVLFILVFICVTQELVVTTLYRGGYLGDSDPHHFISNNTSSQGNSTRVGKKMVALRISEWLHTVAYSSVGIMGFFVFGTARAVRHIWWHWAFRPKTRASSSLAGISGSISTIESNRQSSLSSTSGMTAPLIYYDQDRWQSLP